MVLLISMKIELTKKQAEGRIKEFFFNIKSKNKEQIRKIKRLAMHYNIKLKEKRKLFCKSCYSSKLRVKSIKKGIKTLECENCRKISRWKIKKDFRTS